MEDAVDLVVRLMLQYGLTIDQVRGHFEEDTAIEVDGKYVAVPANYDGPEEVIHWGNPDPGEKFLGILKEKVIKRLEELKKEASFRPISNLRQQELDIQHSVVRAKNQQALKNRPAQRADFRRMARQTERRGRT